MGACASAPEADARTPPPSSSSSSLLSTMRLRVDLSPAVAAPAPESPGTLCDALLGIHGVRVVHTSSPSPCATACVSPRYAVLSPPPPPPPPPPPAAALEHDPPALAVHPPGGPAIAAPVAVVVCVRAPLGNDDASATRTASLPAVTAPAHALRTGYTRTATDTRPLHARVLAVA